MIFTRGFIIANRLAIKLKYIFLFVHNFNYKLATSIKQVEQLIQT